MAHALRNFVDRFLGRGAAAVTVPPLDGALKPNSRIEEAPAGVAAFQPDDILMAGGNIHFSTGNQLRTLSAHGEAVAFNAAGEITALAGSPSGLIALACAPGGIVFHGGTGKAGSRNWTNITAMAFADDGALHVAIGSTENGIDDWQRDLLDGGASGEVWRLDVATGDATRIAGGLAYPNGLVVEPGGTVVVSESWKKRLVRLSPAGKPIAQVMEDLPGYPSRIARGQRGGYWLSVFAPRSQLIEFVLREPEYRRAMMAEVDREYWVAPALRSGHSFQEPMQGGALKQMGILKPWAPTRSYGLVIELTPDFEPVRSLHSRAGGRRHGITAAAEHDGTLWLASKGGHEIVPVDLLQDKGARP